jgi:hypothetical protein
MGMEGTCIKCGEPTVDEMVTICDDCINNRNIGCTYAGWAEAFAIFAKYETGLHGIHIMITNCVQAGPHSSVVSVEDLVRLEVLGWKPYNNVGFRHFVA